mmetsp:Transcript_10653/g.16517  ORF Transcript_10653/g.16517 Transcript_10653/m.16517 type:complete len:143 (-) Transcript_10653:151-579(-)
MDDNKKIGTGLLVLGVIFLFFGVILFFDSGLLAIGDVLFLSGIAMTIGVSYTVKFFARPDRLRGTIVFFLGIFLVFIGWAKIGMILQVFGFINLFGQFFPIVVSTLRATPVIGNILNLPVIAPIIDKLAGSANNKRIQRAPV